MILNLSALDFFRQTGPKPINRVWKGINVDFHSKLFWATCYFVSALDYISRIEILCLWFFARHLTIQYYISTDPDFLPGFLTCKPEIIVGTNKSVPIKLKELFYLYKYSIVPSWDKCLKVFLAGLIAFAYHPPISLNHYILWIIWVLHSVFFQPLQTHMGLRDVAATLPPGFRFYPRDEELVCHYLYKRIANEMQPLETMVEIDLHTCEPWQLPGECSIACSLYLLLH